MANIFPMKTEKSQIGSSKAAHFFTVILSSAPRLKIPELFVTKYGHNFPRMVCLETRSGPIWQVELTRTNDEVWLDKGFQEFKEYYSIGLGYFLVFRYDMDFYFNVLIYDLSACEIDYPCTAPKQNHQNNIDKTCNSKEWIDISDSEEEVSVEILEEFSTKRAAKRTKQTLNCVSLPNYQSKSIINKTMKVKTEQTDELPVHFQQDITKEWNVGTRFCPPFPVPISKQTVKGKEKEKSIAYQRAQAFKSKNPSFICFMQPSYVSDNYQLIITKYLAEKYISKQRYCDVLLHVPDGRTWKVKCSNGSINAKIQWRKFAQDNDLSVGDVCVFERENDAKYPFVNVNVIIFRANEDGSVMEKPENSRSREYNTSKSPPYLKLDVTKCNVETRNGFPFPVSRINQTVIEKETCITYRRAKAFKSKNPFLIYFMQPSYVSYPFIMSIPKTFTEKYLTDQPCYVVLRVPNGRTWKVKCYTRSSYAKFAWKKFVQDNGLCVGDACVFERDDDTKFPFLNVIIFRTEMPKNFRFQEKEKMTAESGVALPNDRFKSIQTKRLKLDKEQTNATLPYLERGVKAEERNVGTKSHPSFIVSSKKTVIKKENSIAYQRAKAFNSKNPFFVSFMRSVYLSSYFNLSIPKAFAQKYLTDEKTCDVVLRVYDGRTWKVKCYIGSNAALFWKNFVLDNGLCVGDACVFERQNDSKRPFLNVIVFRASEDADYMNMNSITEKPEDFCSQTKKAAEISVALPDLKTKLKTKQTDKVQSSLIRQIKSEKLV